MENLEKFLKKMSTNTYLNNRLDMDNQLDLKHYNIDKESFDYLLLNFDKLEPFHRNAFATYCFASNHSKNLQLTPEHIRKLILQNDLSQCNYSQVNLLCIALTHNKRQHLNITGDLWDHLIDNSNLQLISKSNGNALSFAIIYNDLEELNLDEKQISKLIAGCIKTPAVNTLLQHTDIKKFKK